MGISQEVLRVDFQEANRRANGRHFGDMRKPQADSGSCWFPGAHDAHSKTCASYLGVLLPPTIRSQ
jgi:hypothetical protein